MLIHPNASDVTELQKIWCEGFPEDTDGFCQLYFREMFQPQMCVAVCNGKELESAIHLLDLKYKSKAGKEYGFYYLYGGATRKKYRGSGNLKIMADYSLELAHETGRYGIVAGAADGLISLYDSWKFLRLKERNVCLFNGIKEVSCLGWRRSSFAEYQRLHEKYLEEIGWGFTWEEKAERFRYEDVCMHGTVLTCTHQGKEYFAVCVKEEEQITVQETSVPWTLLGELVKCVCWCFSFTGEVKIWSGCTDYGIYGYKSLKTYCAHYKLCWEMEDAKELEWAYFFPVGD